jgi:hypothetical protein
LILTRDSKNVKEGLRLLGMGLEILPEALMKCEGVYVEIQKLSAELS